MQWYPTPLTPWQSPGWRLAPRASWMFRELRRQTSCLPFSGGGGSGGRKWQNSGKLRVGAGRPVERPRHQGTQYRNLPRIAHKHQWGLWWWVPVNRLLCSSGVRYCAPILATAGRWLELPIGMKHILAPPRPAALRPKPQTEARNSCSMGILSWKNLSSRCFDISPFCCPECNTGGQQNPGAGAGRTSRLFIGK